MKLFYLVAIGIVNRHNGGTPHSHGSVICTFGADLSEEQRQQIDDALGCANVALCDKATYEAEYKPEHKA